MPVHNLRKIGLWGFAITAALMASITLNPERVDAHHGQQIVQFLDFLHRHGMPHWFGYRKLEFAANVALTIPLGLFLGFALPKERRWAGYLALPALSATIELAQKVLLPERVASLTDVIANSLGAWLGLALAGLIEARIRRRSRDLGC